MFKGEYNHTIDTKGRLIIPSRLRDELGDRFVVTKGLDGCLFAFTNEEFERFADTIDAMPSGEFGKDQRMLSRFLVGGACDCDIDKQGRVLLPTALRNFANLDKEVVLVGVTRRIEIWAKERWEQINENCNMEEMAENMFMNGTK